jgi:undecaprenyl-diphosphatase
MSVPAGGGHHPSYAANLIALVRNSLWQIVRPPSHSRRAEAARRLARHSLLVTATASAAIIALMVWLDAREIGWMPPRGAPGLWPVRILTDFGKDTYVLSLVAAMVLIVGLVAAARRGTSRAQWLGFGLRLQFVFFALAVPLLAGEMIKWAVGRGRPFVGGHANPFNFSPFVGTEAYASFPSAHAITAFALAFAVSALWPRARAAMIVYALLIAASRLGFAIHRDGQIVPLRSLSGYRKRVARSASAP